MQLYFNTPCVLIAMGKGQKKRKPLGEIAHRERWGQPFAFYYSSFLRRELEGKKAS